MPWDRHKDHQARLSTELFAWQQYGSFTVQDDCKVKSSIIIKKKILLLEFIPGNNQTQVKQFGLRRIIHIMQS